jgi:hypothetical protein
LKNRLLIVLALLLLAAPVEANVASTGAVLAYVGPGAGLGAIGALLAVAGAVLIGLFGLVLYPLHLAKNWLRGRTENTAGAEASHGH